MIGFDELCLRQSPPLWLWVGVSRQTRRVLAVALGDRTDELLARAWAQVPADYRGKPVYTDHWGAYARLLPEGQHHPCDKGSGLTSIVESLNTKWRQRQSGLVRRSCGVHPRMATDLSERFCLLVDEHNALLPVGGRAQCASACWWTSTIERARGATSTARRKPRQQRSQTHSQLM